ncbi:MAG: Hint domain-containing protein [Pseudomonadota bacterium]
MSDPYLLDPRFLIAEYLFNDDNEGERPISGRTFEDSATATDGEAQTGTNVGSANTLNGPDVLDLDGVDDAVLIAPSEAFQIDQGALSLDFVQNTQVGRAPDTLISRDSKNFDDGGHLTIQATRDGAVTVRHQTDAKSETFKTPDDFFAVGDEVHVFYQWDNEGEDGLFVVQNLTTGAEYREEIDAALTINMGPDFNEPWTIGASQAGSGDNSADNLRDFFDGQIDNVRIYDVGSAGPAPDGIVSGTGAADLIDAAYTGDPEGDLIDAGDALLPGEGPDDDIVLAGAGDDTVKSGAGDDDIFAGAGDDLVEAGPGDDILRGEGGNDTLIGGEGADAITGEDGADVIIAGVAGSPDLGFPDPADGDPDPENDKDTVDGGAGDDTITTGDDADVIFGGAGEDVIDGGIDADTIDGGADDDRIFGGEGSDEILGGGGDDVIFAGADPDAPNSIDITDADTGGASPDPVPQNDRDFVDGGAGDDTIFGADDDDTLLGGTGDDFLDGGIDDDSLEGGAGADVLLGGQGNDTLEGGNDGARDEAFGGDDRDVFSGFGSGDVVDGGAGGDDFDVLDLTGSVTDPGGSLEVTFTSADKEDGFVEYFDEDGVKTGQLDFEEIENVVVCFTPGALIATPRGARTVESLRPGDRVITRDNGIQEIAWTGARTLTSTELALAAEMRPVLIRAGALGHGLPERDMVVSPQHRVLVASDKAQLFFEEREVLAAAKHLVGMEGVSRLGVGETTYVHFMCENHEVVLANGAWTETFQPGDYTLGSMGHAARDEIFALFPELRTDAGLMDYVAARRSLKRHEAALLFAG